MARGWGGKSTLHAYRMQVCFQLALDLAWFVYLWNIPQALFWGRLTVEHYPTYMACKYNLC